jgi:hypothetical protein
MYSGFTSQKVFSVDKAMILIDLMVVPKRDFIN